MLGERINERHDLCSAYLATLIVKKMYLLRQMLDEPPTSE